MSKTQRKKQRPVPPMAHITLSPGPTVVLDGKVWRLGFNSQDAKSRLEELFRGHVVRDALMTKRAVGGPDGEEQFAAEMARVRGGHYAFFADGWRELLGTRAGNVLYLLSLLQEHHPDATEQDAMRLLVQENEQTVEALAAITPTFLSAAAVQMGMRPGDAPALVAAAVAELARMTPGAAPDTASTPAP